MSQVKSHSSYKESGVEWIGDIPHEWKVTKLKFVSDIISGYSFKSDDYKDEGIPVIRIGDISNNINLDSTKKVNLENVDKFKGFLIKYGDILIAMTGATVGKTAVYKSHEKSLLNQRVGIFRSRSNFNNKYLSYIIASNVFNGPVKFIAYGGAQENIGTNDLGNIFIPITNLENQNIITQYLDNKTFQIDSLISDKERLIELLEEKRQAVITETVTKGIDPNVKIKDSGIEWIGEIPEHWEIVKLKRMSNIELSNVDKKTVKEEEPVLLCNYVDVYYNNIIIPDLDFMKATAKNEQIKKFSLKEDDVIITKDSEDPNDIAVPAWVSQTMNNVLCGYHLAHIRPGSILSGKYLLYCLLSTKMQEQYHSLAYGVTRYGILKGDIENSLFSLPPVNEQKRIADYLTEIDGEIEKTSSIIKKQISKLKEYRESLIYEAVTGKIDVRDYVTETEEVH